MKSIVRSLSVFFLLVFLTSVSNAQWITDAEYGFKIKVPNGWNKEKTQDGTDRVHDFLDPTENIFIEVRAFETAEGFTPDILAQVFETSGLPEAERLAYEDYTLNGTQGKFAGYKTTINGLTVGVGAFYAVTRDFSYIVWSLIPIDVYNQYSAQSDAVLNTFTIIPKVTKRYVAKPDPSIELIAFKISDQITNDYDITVEKKSFPVTTPYIWVVYDWKGNGNGSAFFVNWYHEGQYIRGASKEFKMPDFQDGYGYANIDMDGAFKVGKYSVEAKIGNKVMGTIHFEVFPNQSDNVQIRPPGGQSSNNSSSTVWGKASTSSNSASSSKKSSGKVKTVKLGGSNNFYNFKKGTVTSHDEADLLNEPWCTEFPALCGNWVRTGKQELNQVNSAPSTGYISDNTSYMDCQQAPLNDVLVFKLKDGTYAKVLITDDQFSKTSNGCNHNITLQIIYPAF